MMSGWNQNNGGKLKKGPWTYEEDVRLLRYITLHGPGRWSALAKSAGLQRCGKSCRLRWVNYLRPDLKRGSITPEEEQTILDLHARWGNRWSLIAEKMPGRTDNEIKNYWRSHIRKKHLSPSTCTQNLSSSSSQKRAHEFAATEEDVHQSHASAVKVEEENEPNHSGPAKNSKIENLAGEELEISQTGDKAKENNDGNIHGYYGYQANENNEEESGILRMMCYYSSPEQTASACGFMDTSLWEEYYLESQLDMDLTALWNISLSPHLN